MPNTPPALIRSAVARWALAFASFCAIILLGASAWLAYSKLAGAEASDTLADRVLAAEKLLTTLDEAETGQRGFLLTGETAYLQPYIAAPARLQAELAFLEKAPEPFPGEQQRVESIRALAEAKMNVLRRTVTLRQMGHLDEALSLIRTGEGKHMMDEVRLAVDGLQQALAGRVTSARARTGGVRNWAGPVFLASLASLLLGGVAFAQRRARHAITRSFTRLDRFTRAFGLAQGMVRDLDGRITFWTEGAERLYGYAAHEAVGRCSHVLLRTRFPEPLAAIETTFKRDGFWRGELVHRCKDGAEITVASHWALHCGREEEAASVIEVNNDVTALKQAEIAALASEATLSAVLDALPVGVVITSAEGKPMRDNAASQALWSLPSRPKERWKDYGEWVAWLPQTGERIKDSDWALARALSHGETVRNELIETLPFGSAERRFLLDNAAPVRDAAGRIIAAVSAQVDVTETRRDQQARAESDRLLRAIVETAPGLIYAKDLRGRMVLASGAVLTLFGKSWSEVEGRTERELLDDQHQAEAIMTSDGRVMETGQAEEMEEMLGWERGRPRVWLSTKTPLRNASGAVTGLVGVSVEITERKQAEERLRLLIYELNHRAKNTLATVQAIASQSLRSADGKLREVLEGRLQALSAAHDVLTRESWAGAELEDVIAGALSPFAGTQAAHFSVSGPKLRLLPRAALALAMGLHELSTNAVKYGALSRPGGQGRIDIRWSVSAGTLHLTWSEHGGPEVVYPTRRGFGSRLIERSLAQDIGGTASMIFEAEGLICRIEAPLSEVAASAEVTPFPAVGTLGLSA